MKGMYGAMLIGLAIFVAILGGYLLNAEKVTTCETEWEYVTDISGAFQGDKSDMDVPYNPPANVTGWSAIDDPEGNGGWISGVYFDTVTSTNAYPIYTEVKQYAQLYADVSADSHDGLSVPDYTVTSSETVTGEMPDGFGYHSSAAVAVFKHGDATEYGAFAVPLSAVLRSCIGTDYGAIAISMQNVGGFPCIATFTTSIGTGTWTHGNDQLTSVLATFTAVNSSPEAKAYPQEGAVTIDGERCKISDAYVVFGQAQYMGAGAYTDSVTVSLLAEPVVLPSYMDPAKGVQPYVGTYVTSDVQVTEHPGSSSPTVQMAFTNRYGQQTANVSVAGTVGYVTTANTTGTLFGFEFASLGNGTVLAVDAGGSSENVTGSTGAATLVMEPRNGSFVISVGGQDLMTFTASGPFASITFDITSWNGVGTLETSVGKDSGDVLTHSGFDDWAADLSYRTTAGTETSTPFDRAYWRNGYDNSSVSMAFIAGENESKTAHLTIRGPSGAGPSSYWIAHDSDGWRVRTVFDADGVAWHEIGKWQAVMVEFSPIGATVYPVGIFKTFIDFVTVGAPTEIHATVQDPQQVIQSIVAYSTGSDMRMGVTGTVTHIAEGGLYLQNGVFTLRDSFPTADAVSLTIGSTAHLGTSITFSGSGRTVTLPVNPDRTVTINGAAYPLNGLTFRWYSPDGPSASIGGQTYAPGVYQRGQTYAAGTIWAEAKGGQMVPVLENAGDWAMTLDGVWAPAVNMYDGHNSATETTELADWTHGIFRWDANTFLIVMMGVVVLGGVVGAYLKLCTTADWIVIGMAVGVMWLIL